MHQNGLARRALSKGGQGLFNTAKHEMVVIRDTIGMSADFALEYDDLTLWQTLSQMIKGSAIAKTELEHSAIQSINGLRGNVNASTLRLEAPDEAIQSTQRNVSISPLIPSIRTSGRDRQTTSLGGHFFQG